MHPSSKQPSLCGAEANSSAEKLNHDCFCSTLNREQLNKILKSDDLAQDVLETHPQLFSNSTVFISRNQMTEIREIVHSIERIVQLKAFHETVLAAADDAAKFSAGNSGVFMGYDFHLSPKGPQVIEINTNAGGAFLNTALLSAQAECCHETESLLPISKPVIDNQFVEMFLNEYRYKNTKFPLVRIAIVDDNPKQQFLYPEFKMAKRLFERHGIEAVIVDPSQFRFEKNILSVDGNKIDLVYNRLTDFSLKDQKTSVLRAAYLHGSVVVTPNPYHYALYANKRNLALLSNADNLNKLGVCEADIKKVTSAIPMTHVVSSMNAEQLWTDRKHLFFKPTEGFGSRAAYRGDKLTKRVWKEIKNGDYVAQRIVLPTLRGVFVDGQETALKMDIRAYVYEGEIQLLAARLYQGQTTNFRTSGGGFASVFTH